MTKKRRTIGLIPAAGSGSRLGDLPFSKELLPIHSTGIDPDATQQQVRLAIDHSLGALRSAGVSETCVVVANGKWDIPTRLKDGSQYGQSIAYVVLDNSPHVPATLDSAYFITQECDVALLFPDIVFEPASALRDLVEIRQGSDVDVFMALVPTQSGEKVDIVTVAESDSISLVTPKPGKDYAGWTWVAATWGPRFSEFVHESLATGEYFAVQDRELYVADLLNAAIDKGMTVSAMKYPDGSSYDLGTFQELMHYWRRG